MTTHPLIEATLTIDCAAKRLLRHASTHEKEQVRDALKDLHIVANEVFVRDVAAGYGDLTPEVFQEVVRRAHAAGMAYPDMVEAFNKAQGTS